MPHADPSKIAILPIDPHRGTVSCPRKGCEVPYEECVSCEYAWLVDVGSDPATSHVVCEVVTAPPEDRKALPLASNAASTPVSEIMTREVISVHANLPLERLILLLIDEDISGAPVVDDQGHPIGIVSRSDLVTDDYDWADLRDDFLSYPRVAGGDPPEELFLPELFRSHCARDIMSPVVKISASTSIARAALAITNSHSHRALVVDAQNKLAGIVTEFDLARWLAAIAEQPEASQ